VAGKAANVSASRLVAECTNWHRVVSVATVQRDGVMTGQAIPGLSIKPQNSAQAVKKNHQRRKIIYLLDPATN
jgi:hypothetical protein